MASDWSKNRENNNFYVHIIQNLLFSSLLKFQIVHVAVVDDTVGKTAVCRPHQLRMRKITSLSIAGP
jgi:hypothetical protein